MSICPHGVEVGIAHELNRDADGHPLDVTGRPEQTCPCCKGRFTYDAPLDARRRSKHCAHCQAATAHPAKDHLADAPKYRGGPHDGTRHPILPGAEPEDRITAIGHEEHGHYVRAADGHYDWLEESLTPIYEAPPSPHRKKG